MYSFDKIKAGAFILLASLIVIPCTRTEANCHCLNVLLQVASTYNHAVIKVYCHCVAEKKSKQSKHMQLGNNIVNTVATVIVHMHACI